MRLFKKGRPKVGHVVDRTFATAATMMLGTLQRDLAEFGELPTAGWNFHEELLEWVRDEGIAKSFSNEEKRLHKAGLGEWTKQDVTNVTWLIEDLGVFLWALGKVEQIPSYDVNFTDSLSRHIRTKIGKKGFASELRTPEDIDHARDLSELWHWRGVNARFVSGDLRHLEPNPQERLEYALSAAATARLCGDIPELIDGDFPAFGKAYKDLDEDERYQALSTAMERERAFNWLVGDEWDWDKVETNT